MAMAPEMFGLVVCSGLLSMQIGLLAFVYRCGRYGFPIEIKRRTRVDRRARPVVEESDAPAVEVYRYDSQQQQQGGGNA